MVPFEFFYFILAQHYQILSQDTGATLIFLPRWASLFSQEKHSQISLCFPVGGFANSHQIFNKTNCRTVNLSIRGLQKMVNGEHFGGSSQCQ